MNLRCVIRWVPPEKNKVCAVYWVIANLPIKYRSALSPIYLAVLCKSADLKNFGDGIALDALLKDIQIVENRGVFIQRLGQMLKVLWLLSLLIGAHSLAGFQESFNVDTFCRFCLASRRDIQTIEVGRESFPLRTYEASVSKLKQDTDLSCVDGVKSVF